MHKIKPPCFILRYIRILIFASIILNIPTTFADSIAIITASQDFQPLSSGKAKMLFKGKVKRLDNKKYSLVDWPAGSKIKQNFYLRLMGQSETKINAIRAKSIFSGQGFPPKVIAEDNFSALEIFLKTHPNSIGYAPTSSLSDQFIVLFIIQAENNDEK